MEYATTAWASHTKKVINKLENVQRSAARFVSNDYRRTSSVTSMIQKVGWQTPVGDTHYRPLTVIISEPRNYASNVFFFRMSIKVGTRVEVVGKGVVGTVAYIGATLFSGGILFLFVNMHYDLCPECV